MEKEYNRCLLQHTETIKDQDVQVHEKWEFMKDCYNEVSKNKEHDWTDRAVLSVVNSIICQRRVFFALTPELTEGLFKADKNWKSRFKKCDYDHDTLVNRLIEYGIVDVEMVGLNGTGYKLIHEDILYLTKGLTGNEQSYQIQNMYKQRIENSKNKPWIKKRRLAFLEATETLTKEEKQHVSFIYKHSREISKYSGVKHHVDHIIPITKGGKHRPDNLQVITAQENLKKGSKV